MEETKEAVFEMVGATLSEEGDMKAAVEVECREPETG